MRVIYTQNSHNGLREEGLRLLHFSVAILSNQLTHLFEVNLAGSIDINLHRRGEGLTDRLIQTLSPVRM